MSDPSDDFCGDPSGSSGSSGCEALRSSHPPDCGRLCDERTAWKREVALQVSVDVEHVPVTVRLAGMLDGETAVNLVPLVAELMAEGYLNFDLQTSALCVPYKDGVGTLNGLKRLVQHTGGSLAWDGLTLNHPFPAKSGNLGMRANSAWCTQVSTFDDHNHPVQSRTFTMSGP